MKTEKLRAFSLALSCLFLCAISNIAHADGSISITEIMYDPAGTDTNREWVEIYNGSASGIDISKYSFLTDGVPSTHHGLTAQGSSIVPAGSYAVIVQNPNSFKLDYPGYTGLMFDSSWSGLTATSGKTLAVLDDQGNVLDQVTYDPSIGADNDGNSLQKLADGTWVAAAPTPGAASASASSASGTDSGGTDDTASGSADASETGGGLPANDGSSSSSPIKEQTQMKASLTAPKNAISGVPIAVSSNVIGYFGEEREYGIFHYAFGDGSATDARSPNALAHTYLFPGSYDITFEYRSSDYPKDPEITAQATIEVAAPPVTISTVNDDGSIELSNSAKLPADISGWNLEIPGMSLNGSFTIPQGTIILAGKTITLAQSILGFNATPASLLELLLPSGAVASTYAGASDQLAPATNVEVSSTAKPKVSVTAVIKKKAAPKSKPTATNATAVEANVLGAALAAPSTRPHTDDPAGPLIPIALGIAGIIVGSIIGLRRLPVFSKKSSKDKNAEPSEPSTQAVADKIRIVEE